MARMVIVYCDKCGRRVPDDDVATGRAARTGENGWLCTACAAPPKPVTQQIRTGAPSSTAAMRRSGAVRLSQTDAPPVVPQKEPAKPFVLAVAAAACGIGLLLAGIFLLCRGQSPESRPALATHARESPPAEKPLEPPLKTAAAVADSPSGKSASSSTAAGQAAPAVTAPSMAERARQAEKEMQDFRNQRATRLLEEHRAWFKQNPSDAWTYQAKLRELVASYGSAPGAIEAKRLLDELGTLPPRPDRLETSAPEAKEFQLVYDLDISRIGANVVYDVDNRDKVKQPFDRIAYFLELQPAAGETQYVFVSMDAFTDDLGKIGVPTHASGARFQQNVANMNVCSNVQGLVTGTGLTGGNIEFWASNYGPRNSANVPNALNDKYDFGDEPTNPPDGYGSMQVHNHDAKQTVFALNHWRQGGGADLGIGNRPTDNPDWTFTGNAGSYRARRLRVLVHCK